MLPSYRAILDREGVATPVDVAIIGSEDEVRERIAGIADAGATEFASAIFAPDGDTSRSAELLRRIHQNAG